MAAGRAGLSLNQLEAEDLANARMPEEDSLLRPFGERIARGLDVDTLMITRGGRGVCLWLREGTYYRIPGHTVEVADIASAGGYHDWDDDTGACKRRQRLRGGRDCQPRRRNRRPQIRCGDHTTRRTAPRVLNSGVDGDG